MKTIKKVLRIVYTKVNGKKVKTLVANSKGKPYSVTKITDGRIQVQGKGW